MYSKLYIYALATLVALLMSVSAFGRTANTPADSSEVADSLVYVPCSLTDSLLDYADNYLGTRYRSGGKTPKGFDCSGFVYYVFGKFGYKTSPSSSAVRTIGKEVDKEDARPGDIIYFTGRNSRSKRPGHVGIITEIKDGTIYFIHASVNLGISYSTNQTPYYKKRFMGIRRVLD